MTRVIRRDAPVTNLTDAEGLISRIVRAWHPVAIWLFGSRARGSARPDSDWDLLVVVPDETPDADDPLAGWRVQKEAGVPADVVLCRRSEFQDAREVPNTLAFEAAHHGLLIHGS